MTNLYLQKAKDIGLKTTLLAAMISLASCGGGGSDGYYGGTNPENPTTGEGTSDPSTGNVSGLVLAQFDILDPDTQKPISSIGVNGAIAKVKVTNNDKTPVTNALVKFGGAAEFTFGNSSASVLTDKDGNAQLFFKPNSSQVSGAYTVSVDASYNNLSVKGSKYINIAATNIELSDLTLGDKKLDSSGQTSISLKVIDLNTKTGINGVPVSFTSDCGQINPNTYTSANQGDVIATYKSINTDGTLCSGVVNISASTNSGSSIISKKDTLTITAPTATSIVFPEGQNTIIGIAGSGSVGQAVLNFVAYSNSTPLPGKEIEFSLVKSPLGLSLGQKGKTIWTVKTDENGNAPITVYPGTTPGPVEIKATVKDNTSIFALSKNITVATARPSQNNISLSLSTNSVEGWGIDGTTASITMRVADQFGNAVPDGTILNFTAEGGQIGNSCSTKQVDKISLCSVTFASQDFRPRNGRITILGVVEGEKAYIDNNKNNTFDSGDVLVRNIGDTYRDDDENAAYTVGELIYPLRTGETGACGSTNSAIEPNINNTCTQNLDGPLRRQSIIMLAGSRPSFENVIFNTSSLSFDLYSIGATNNAGQYNVPMPGGTVLSTEIKDNTDNFMTCKIIAEIGDTKIPSLLDAKFGLVNGDVRRVNTKHGYRFTDCARGDTIAVITTTPSGFAQKTTWIF